MSTEQIIYIVVSLVLGWLARHYGIGAPANSPASPLPVSAPSPSEPHPVVAQWFKLILDALRDLQARLPPPAK